MREPATDNSLKHDVLQSLHELKSRVLPSAKMYLFGSRARGDATAESDWDILLLIDKHPIAAGDFEAYASPILDLGWEYGQYFSVKLYSSKEWKEREHTPFYYNVTQDAIEI